LEIIKNRLIIVSGVGMLMGKKIKPSEEFEWRYHRLVENIPDMVYSLDQQGNIVTVNKAISIYGFTFDELVGRPFLGLIYFEDRDRVSEAFHDIVAHGKNYSQTQQFRIQTKAGDIRWVEANSAFRFSAAGRFMLQEGVCRDITDRIEAQEALLKAQNELEELVHQRTKELTKANLDLQKEIDERRETENILREREKELEMEKANLEEANTAFKVLLKRREVDKRAVEEQVMYNVKKLLLPYVEKIKKKVSNERKLSYLSIIETNLNDITNSFSRRLSIDFYGLTNSELKVANLIQQGKKSGAIASLLGISIRTVEAYRLAIRRKLRIQNKKVNLRTYLRTFN